MNKTSEEDMKDDEAETKEENSVCRTEAWRTGGVSPTL